MKTSELTGAALDWAVAKCEGHNDLTLSPREFYILQSEGDLLYSTNWAQGGPIIERERIDVLYDQENEQMNDPVGWFAQQWMLPLADGIFRQVFGPTPLIAAMRCYCCAKLGDAVDIPEELK